MFARATECTQSKCSAMARVLLLWIGPMKCQISGKSDNARDFLQRLLHIIFAELALSGGMRGAHLGRSKGLAHRKQGDFAGIASGRARRRGNSRPYGLQVTLDCGHNLARA